MNPTAREAAATLREREVAARREREAHEQHVRQAVEGIVRALVHAPGRAWLVGSLAWGEFGANSDVDLVLSQVDAATAFELERQIARTAGAPVDFLTFEDLPPSFRERILESGVRLV